MYLILGWKILLEKGDKFYTFLLLCLGGVDVWIIARSVMIKFIISKLLRFIFIF